LGLVVNPRENHLIRPQGYLLQHPVDVLVAVAPENHHHRVIRICCPIPGQALHTSLPHCRPINRSRAGSGHPPPAAGYFTATALPAPCSHLKIQPRLLQPVPASPAPAPQFTAWCSPISGHTARMLKPVRLRRQAHPHVRRSAGDLKAIAEFQVLPTTSKALGIPRTAGTPHHVASCWHVSGGKSFLEDPRLLLRNSLPNVLPNKPTYGPSRCS